LIFLYSCKNNRLIIMLYTHDARCILNNYVPIQYIYMLRTNNTWISNTFYFPIVGTKNVFDIFFWTRHEPLRGGLCSCRSLNIILYIHSENYLYAMSNDYDIKSVFRQLWCLSFNNMRYVLFCDSFGFLHS